MPDDHSYFLRSKSIAQATNPTCLSSILFTEQGLFLLGEIIPQCDLNNYWIPVVWPARKEQRGYCCGMYALDTGLKHGFGRSGIETPPARKDGKKNIVSLREFAKKKGLSAFGEIYSVNSLKELAQHFKFPNCEILKPNRDNEEHFTKTVCDKLKKDYVIVTSLDMKGSFPGAAKGLGTHWALIFGYLYHGGQCYFLATQWGQYFLFPAKKVFLSNKQLPEKNPKSYPHFIYYKTEKNEFYRKKKFKENLSAMHIRHPIGDSLSEFQFSLFCIPVIDAPPCINFKDKMMDEVFKPECST